MNDLHNGHHEEQSSLLDDDKVPRERKNLELVENGKRDEEELLFGWIPWNMYNLVILSLSFFLVFTAFNTLQNYITSLLPGDLGNISLTVLYCTVGISVFPSPFLVWRLGEKWSMILGSVCYVIYMVSLIHVIYYVVIMAAVVIGFGAAVLWIAQGAYITQISTEETRGRNSGIFWTIFQMGNVLGNLGAYFIFSHLSKEYLFLIFSVIATIGVLAFLLIFSHRGNFIHPQRNSFKDSENIESKLSIQNEHSPPLSDVTVSQFASSIWKLLHRVELYFLGPMFFWTGFELAFWTGEFPQLLKSHDIGLVLTCAGAAEVFGGFVNGWLSDKLPSGRLVTLILGACVYATGLVIASLYKLHYAFLVSNTIVGISWGAFVAAFCFGFGDSAFNTQVYAQLGSFFPDHHTNLGAFTVFQLLQNIGSAVGFYYELGLPMHGKHGTLWQVYIQSVILVVSTCLFLYVSWKYAVKKQAPLESQ